MISPEAAQSSRSICTSTMLQRHGFTMSTVAPIDLEAQRGQHVSVAFNLQAVWLGWAFNVFLFHHSCEYSGRCLCLVKAFGTI